MGLHSPVLPAPQEPEHGLLQHHAGMGDVSALTTRNLQAFAQISVPNFQDLLSPLFSFLFLWGQPSWVVSVLFCPKNGAVFASPIPCCLPPALFGLSFPVLLICLGETRRFHASCLLSVL